MDLTALRQRLSGTTVPPEAIAAPEHSDDAEGLAAGPLRLAAVLVPLIHGAEPGVLLTVRTAHLSSHAGQVAFPGGRIEPEDPSPEAAALREANEEIGLDPAQVELVGRLPDQITGTGYHITPILGLLPEGLRFHASPDEVAHIFTLPLATLLDPEAPRRETRMFRGRQRRFWTWPHPTHYIWGATAGILVQLAARLRTDLP